MKDEQWESATSEPGELFTVEGRIKQFGVAARGIMNNDPRTRRYQRAMMAPALVFLGIAVVVVILSIVL